MMQEDQKGYKNNNIRAEEEQITAARAKQHEDEEEDTGIRPARRENTGTKRETRQKELNKRDNKCHCCRFRAPPIELNKNKQKVPLTVGLKAILAHVLLMSRTGTLPHDLPFRFCIRRQL